MGLDLGSLQKRLTSAYPRTDLKEVIPLPDGFADVLTQSGDTATLKVQGLTAVLDASDGTAVLSSKGRSLELSLGFSAINVTQEDPQIVRLDLNGGILVEAFAIGLIRFTAPNGATLTTSTADAEATDSTPYHAELENEWWVTSDEPVRITSNELTADSTVFAFFRESDGGEYFKANLVRMGDADLIIPDKDTSISLHAMRLALWFDTEKNIEILRKNAYPDKSEFGVLKRQAKMIGIVPLEGETEAALRLRYQGKAARLRGGIDFGNIAGFVASLIGGGLSDVAITRNRDANDKYAPAFYRVSIEFDRLGNLGFEPEEWPGALNDIEEILGLASAVGVLGEVAPIGGAEWDTDAYDTEGDVYGA